MIGHGNVSQLVNNTTNGISESPPLNNTYVFTFQESTSFLGGTKNVESSLPTPSGIAVSPDGNTLWITEHVDSSFDSFNIHSNSLDRFWTSKTDNEFGYSVSLPNGIAVDKEGTVWIAEHGGNKIGEFDPANNQLTEYPVPCCNSTSAGVYTLALGQNGTIWFVEIFGNAIGELKPDISQTRILSIELKQVLFQVTSLGSAIVPINILQVAASNFTSTIKMDISGISNTGIPTGAQANFTSNTLELTGTQNVTTNLRLTFQSLNPGVYYLTVSAKTDSGIIYSAILKVVVSSSYNQLFVYGAIGGGVASLVVILYLVFRMRSMKRRFLPSGSKFRRSRANVIQDAFRHLKT
jgi:DNA-binding beta-propeller fold protein YncE